MQLTCPCCGSRFPIEAALADDDGKRLAALFAVMEPALGRAVLRYLRFFKPAKQALRNARAVIVVESLLALVNPGTVCRDERGGVRRPATQTMWADGIDAMLADPEKLTLPLANHNYLRAIVYGIADKADATAERAHETALRNGDRTAPSAPIDSSARLKRLEALSRINGDLELGLITEAEAEHRRREAAL